jgi:hypothetical protein
MEINTIKKTRNRIIGILLLSILCLIFISFLPWISVSENGIVKQNLNYNLKMMENSNSQQIIDLSNNLRNINILFWIVIIITLVSFILILYQTMIKNSLFNNILILIMGLLIFLISIFIFLLQIFFSRTINEIDYISASMIYSHLAYPYIQFIISIILLIFSAINSITLSKDLIIQQKSLKKEKAKEIKKIDEEKISYKFDEEDIKISTKEAVKNKASLDIDKATKIAQIEELFKEKTTSTDKENIEEEHSTLDRDYEKKINISSNKKIYCVEEKSEKYDQSKESIKKDDVNLSKPFPTEKPKEKKEDSEELRVSQHFEEALSSAIRKKQSDMKLHKTEKKDEKQYIKTEQKIKDLKEQKRESIFETEKVLLEKEGKTIKKIHNLRCPQCNHIFSVEQDDGTHKIKCPKCGIEGISNKEF